MAEEISPELFNHLVELAALELTAEEGEYLRGELNNQLKAIDELAAIEIPEGTPLAAHGVPFPPELRPAARADETSSAGLNAEILAGAPETDDGYLQVPGIPHEELD
ncbi:MAG: hypothetical protein KIS85_05115 [Anaerolineales bacterium]|nr:hypothetical protein [Anaerolineales bacterium]